MVSYQRTDTSMTEHGRKIFACLNGEQRSTSVASMLKKYGVDARVVPGGAKAIAMGVTAATKFVQKNDTVYIICDDISMYESKAARMALVKLKARNDNVRIISSDESFEMIHDAQKRFKAR